MEANQALKYHLGIDNAWLAYPYGDYDDQVVEICKKAGIKMVKPPPIPAASM